MKLKCFFIGVIAIFSLHSIQAQTEWSAIGGLSLKKGLGFSLGGIVYKHPYMGSRRLESFSFEFERTYHGSCLIPKYSMAFCPHLGLNGSKFKRKNKWYGTNVKHFIEFSIAPHVAFKDGMGVYVRPEIGYLWNTPLKRFKLRAAYGYDIEFKKRENFESKPGILSFKFIYVFALKGMYI